MIRYHKWQRAKNIVIAKIVAKPRIFQCSKSLTLGKHLESVSSYSLLLRWSFSFGLTSDSYGVDRSTAAYQILNADS